MSQTLIDQLKKRARIYQHIRAFFSQRNHLEVDTPLLGWSTNPDRHIQSIEATVNRKPAYLQTSPEFYMKRLLCAGSGSIFQICHAFRDEERGRRHAPEFSLLEWYSVGFDYHMLMEQMQDLISQLMARDLPFQRLSYADCFKQYVDIDLPTASLQQLRQCARQHVAGIDASLLGVDDCLDLLISQVIAPQFDGFVFVYDYPASQASLARLKADDAQVAERFELFYRDMELANGFSELVDASEQRQRFEQDNRYRQQQGLPVYPIDEAFLQALEQGLPQCAGVALGLDRLLMVMEGAEHIHQVTGLTEQNPHG